MDHTPEAQAQPEDVEEVPETANALKRLKSANGLELSQLKAGTRSYFLRGEGQWDFEVAEHFSDDEQDPA